MEFVFTAIAIVLVVATYLLVQRFRDGTALCQRPMSNWLVRFEAASPSEQQQMAATLLRHAATLATHMGIEASEAELLASDYGPAESIRTWQAQLPIAMPTTSLTKTPARTIGALMLIRQIEPLRFRQLLGQSTPV